MDELDKRLDEVFDKAKEIASFKSNVYQDLWKRLDTDIIMSAIKLKIERASVCTDREKKIDDLIDVINYTAFLIARLTTDT